VVFSPIDAERCAVDVLYDDSMVYKWRSQWLLSNQWH